MMGMKLDGSSSPGEGPSPQLPLLQVPGQLNILNYLVTKSMVGGLKGSLSLKGLGTGVKRMGSMNMMSNINKSSGSEPEERGKLSTRGKGPTIIEVLQVPFPSQPQTISSHQQQQGVVRSKQHHQNHSSSTGGSGGNKSHSRPKSSSSQTKEKKQSSSSTTTTPVAHYGSTVYQPAGPLIEPHKTSGGSGHVPVGLIPESVRLPPDLKVTYQTHPPTTCVLTSTSSSSSQSRVSGSGGAHHPQQHSNRGSGGGHSHKSSNFPSSTNSSSSSKGGSKILHQPYKSGSTAQSSSTSTSTSSTGNTPNPRSSASHHHHQQQQQSPSSFMQVQQSGGGGSFVLPTPPLSSPHGGSTPMLAHQPGGGIGLNLQGQQPSMSSLSSGSSGSSLSNPGAYYPGYGGAHISPYAPSKYPIVPPDSFRTQSPYPSSFLYAPSQNQQPSQNYFMTPLYTPPITPNPGVGGVGVGGTYGGLSGVQPRTLMAAHLPSSGAGGSYFQSSGPPPNAHPSSNYFITHPSLPTAHPHQSIQPSTAPGHAGPSIRGRNPSSQPACPCPMESCPPNNSISNTNNNSIIRVNNNKPLQLRQPVITALRGDLGRVGVRTSPITTHQFQKNSRNDCSTPPNSITLTPYYPAQAKQSESAKTFTGQYSLPADITITPIIMNPKDSNSLAFTKFSNPPRPETKKRDIVHVIDPRSGQSTTIAKHMSNNHINVNSSSHVVSAVKPNNAGNVGKISPALDVIVLGSGRGPSLPQMSVIKSTRGPSPVKARISPNVQYHSVSGNAQRPGVISSPLRYHQDHPRSGPTPHLVHPVIHNLTCSENKSKKPSKRKGLTLNECIDGLQRKKMRILADTNVSITNVTPGTLSPIPHIVHNNQEVLTLIPVLVNPGGKNPRKLTQPRPTKRKNSKGLLNPGGANMNPFPNNKSGRTASTESEVGNTIINYVDASVAASALVNPRPNGSGPGLKIPHPILGQGSKKRTLDNKKKPLKIKISTNKEGKVTTRSTTQQNSKVRTRGKTGGGSEVHRGARKQEGPEDLSNPRNRGRLLRDKVKSGHRSDTSPNVGNKRTIPTFPSYFNTPKDKMKQAGNGSSTLTTSNNHVILRIPKSSSMERTKGASNEVGRFDRAHHHAHMGGFPSNVTGNMNHSALKKRAIVKPLSPFLVHESLGYKRFLGNPHPRWSNGWTFEGEPFEAEVYLQNEATPVTRRCYPSMRHDSGDIIRARDCVLLKSSPRKDVQPFIAKVAALFVNPPDGEMMFSSLWYYRPEHTGVVRVDEDMPDEVFASKHRDCNSVATIEDKCYVLTYNEYCRYRRRMKELRNNSGSSVPIVPLSRSSSATTVPVSHFATNLAKSVLSGKRKDSTDSSDQGMSEPPSSTLQPIPSTSTSTSTLTLGKVSPEVVFFCRKIYDMKLKKMVKNSS